MAMQENYKDEWLDKAFRLAFFLHGERETAIRIATSAMNKLETASNAQFKRYYYTPTGRAETSRPTRSRVSLNDLQLLQRLVFVESETFEREREIAGKAAEKNLLKFYIKHLVRISLKRNSFYVALGVSRILHNYATSNAMEIYNIVIQDPERVHDDYYYRSRKGVLMKELKERFGDLLETVKVNRGEERFQTRAECENLCQTARESLKFFTPWNSQCALPEKFDPFDDVIKPFYFDKNDPDAEHCIEVNRIHATLHPNCFNRLTGALNLPSPEEKMEIPKFMINTKTSEFDDNDWRNPPHLEADELQKIKDILRTQAASRKAMTAGFLRVVVDGEEQARINLGECARARFDLDAAAELIEVRAVERENEIVLATHLLSFDELKEGNQRQSILLEGGQKVSFNLAPTKDSYGEVTGLSCGVEYAETAWRKRLALGLRQTKFAFSKTLNQSNRVLKPALTFGLVVLVLTLGWLVFRNFNLSKEERVKTPPQQNQNNEIKIHEPAPNEEKELAANNLKTPQKPNQTLSKQAKKPEIAADQKPKPESKPQMLPKKEILIENPPKDVRAENFNKQRKDVTDEDGVLRLPIRETNQKNPDYEFERESAKRGETKKIRGKAIAEMKKFYVEITGDQILGDQFREQILAEFQKSNLFSVTADKEAADGRLLIYIRHESDGDQPQDKSITAIVRLVNAEGFVVFPNRKNVSAWKYVGVIGKLPPRIAGDLVNASKRGK